MLLGLSHGWFNRSGDVLGDFILNCKDIDEIAVVSFGPLVAASMSWAEIRTRGPDFRTLPSST
jgi:hypothetical protein